MGGHGGHHHHPAVDDPNIGNRPMKHKIMNFVIAGAVSGFTEHVVMYPIDTVKTRIQAYHFGSTNRVTTFGLLNKILRTEGLGIYRGVSIVAFGSIPSHSCYFASYEMTKSWLETMRSKHKHDVDIVSTAVAGVSATLAHDAITTPIDVIKQRMQLSRKYKNIFNCAMETIKYEGLRALFRSLPTTLLMNIPQGVSHFYAYESLKYLFPMTEDGDHLFIHHLMAGGGAGAISAVVSTPVDVIKTRLQTQSVHISSSVPSTSTNAHRILYHGLMDTAQTLYNEGGSRIFFRGALPRALYTMPSAAITWIVYEYVKKSLHVELYL